MLSAVFGKPTTTHATTTTIKHPWRLGTYCVAFLAAGMIIASAIVGKDQPAIDTLEALIWVIRAFAHFMRVAAHGLNIFANSLSTFTDNLKPSAPPAK